MGTENTMITASFPNEEFIDQNKMDKIEATKIVMKEVDPSLVKSEEKVDISGLKLKDIATGIRKTVGDLADKIGDKSLGDIGHSVTTGISKIGAGLAGLAGRLGIGALGVVGAPVGAAVAVHDVKGFGDKFSSFFDKVKETIKQVVDNAQQSHDHENDMEGHIAHHDDLDHFQVYTADGQPFGVDQEGPLPHWEHNHEDGFICRDNNGLAFTKEEGDEAAKNGMLLACLDSSEQNDVSDNKVSGKEFADKDKMASVEEVSAEEVHKEEDEIKIPGMLY